MIHTSRPSRFARLGRTALPILCALLSGVLGCGETNDASESNDANHANERPNRRWVRLADAGSASHTLIRGDDLVYQAAGAPSVRVHGDAGSRWLETNVPASAWQRSADLGAGAWFAPVKTWSVGRLDPGERQSLSAGTRRFVHAPPNVMANSWDFPAGSFSASKRGLFLKLEPQETPPEASLLSVGLRTRHQMDDTWRISGRRFSGDGFALHPGEAMEVEITLPPGSVLQFATAIEPALEFGEAMSSAGGQTRFRILLDEAVIFETARNPAGSGFEWHRVELPTHEERTRQAGRARLRFEVDGALAHASFADPVLGVSASTPQPDPGKPDILVFLADTFRADSMKVYGGTLGLTPFLDELSQRSRVQTRAWSVTTHTLPAHATIFSGLFPHQAGVPDERAVLSDQANSIAEVLVQSGYRTGAITDSLVVSDSRGISQGFAWFDERQTTLRSSVERALAFLDSSDGRPTFLFVHSYRAHTPYRVTAATLREHGHRLGIPRLNLAEQRQLIMSTKQLESFASENGQKMLAKLVALYRGGVIDVDRGFGRFVGSLETRNFFDRGVLLFTSDHGEAFGEHNVLYHQGTPWEELARVPLLVHGAGIEPGNVEEPVSLVDLAPSVADLAGVDAHPQWTGSSIFSERPAGPVYTFQASGPGGTLAIVEGDHKAIAVEENARLRQSPLLGAFDLAVDPAERRDLKAQADWPRELVRRHSAGVANALAPILDRGDASLDAEEIERLKAMGYLQEGD